MAAVAVTVRLVWVALSGFIKKLLRGETEAL
jgi:hypothetical protein